MGLFDNFNWGNAVVGGLVGFGNPQAGAKMFMEGQERRRKQETFAKLQPELDAIQQDFDKGDLQSAYRRGFNLATQGARLGVDTSEITDALKGIYSAGEQRRLSDASERRAEAEEGRKDTRLGLDKEEQGVRLGLAKEQGAREAELHGPRLSSARTEAEYKPKMLLTDILQGEASIRASDASAARNRQLTKQGTLKDTGELTPDDIMLEQRAIYADLANDNLDETVLRERIANLQAAANKWNAAHPNAPVRVMSLPSEAPVPQSAKAQTAQGILEEIRALRGK